MVCGLCEMRTIHACCHISLLSEINVCTGCGMRNLHSLSCTVSAGWTSAKARVPYLILALLETLRAYPGQVRGAHITCLDLDWNQRQCEHHAVFICRLSRQQSNAAASVVVLTAMIATKCTLWQI